MLTDTKFYAPVATLSTQDNAKLLEQLKPGFERRINWNKHQSKVSTEKQNQYLDFLINPSFSRNKKRNDTKPHTGYYLAKVETKGYNVMIDGKNFFDQSVKSNMRTYNNIQKIVTSQGHDYTNGCLLNYNYLNKHDKMLAIDLNKQQALDADPKAIQQINFTGNLE